MTITRARQHVDVRCNWGGAAARWRQCLMRLGHGRPQALSREPLPIEARLRAGRQEGVLATQARHCATDSVAGLSVSFIMDTSNGSPPTETSASR